MCFYIVVDNSNYYGSINYFMIVGENIFPDNVLKIHLYDIRVTLSF